MLLGGGGGGGGWGGGEELALSAIAFKEMALHNMACWQHEIGFIKANLGEGRAFLQG